MILSDLFQMLSYGELSNLSMSGDGAGTIADAAKPRIVLYANEALLRLHSRFLLKENELMLQLYDYMTFYNLIPAFAVSFVPASGVTSEPVRYILDTPIEPFRGDIIKILAVFDSTGERMPLNDDGQILSVFTPQANLLQVPQPVYLNTCSPTSTPLTRYLSVLYQAKHPKLLGDLQEEIRIPDIILGALTSYIAYKVFSHMNTQDSTSKAQEYLGMYESICAEATDKDLVNSSISTSNERFHRQGWI